MAGTCGRRWGAALRALVAALAVSVGASTQAAGPANANASPRTRAVSDYFQTICNGTETRLLSGQFAGYGRRSGLAIVERIHRTTGKWPALLGVDYVSPELGRIQWRDANRTARAWWNAGGLVTISAHLPSPINPDGAGLRDRNVLLEDLLRAGTDAHRRWIAQLDELSRGLAELRDAGVVVLWRPFHEMNGDWFWWGGKDPGAFTALWQYMFAYFSGPKKLDNLLWVYSPNQGNRIGSYYPGDRVVDIVGLDAYTDFVDPANIRGYDELAARSKPFGFTESGPGDPRNPPGTYDYRRLLRGIVDHFPRSCFFLSWEDGWSLAQNAFVEDLLADPWVINRDDLPSFAGRPAGSVQQRAHGVLDRSDGVRPTEVPARVRMRASRQARAGLVVAE